MSADIFNDYDELGFRTNVVGCRSSRIEDKAIVYNLRFKFKDALAHLSDVALVNAYDEFAMTDEHGNGDEGFLEFLEQLDV